MAWGDYGAFVFKNGENITEGNTDISYHLIDGRFVKSEAVTEYNEEDKVAEGHAIIKTDDFCICFFKLYDPTIMFKDGRTINTKLSDKLNYSNKKYNIKNFRSYTLGTSESIINYHIEIGEDIYSVFCGLGVGHGFEEKDISKYILKHISFKPERKFHLFDVKVDIDLDYVFDKFERMDEIEHNFREIKADFKKLIKSMFYQKGKPRAARVSEKKMYKTMIRERLEVIKWLI